MKFTDNRRKYYDYTNRKKENRSYSKNETTQTPPNIIKEFEKENILNLSENGGFLYWLTDEQKSHVEAFENKYNALVYHVIHNYTAFGELLAFLFVSDYEEEWETDREELADGYAYAYVRNVNDDGCSELGGICFQTQSGGLVRTA